MILGKIREIIFLEIFIPFDDLHKFQKKIKSNTIIQIQNKKHHDLLIHQEEQKVAIENAKKKLKKIELDLPSSRINEETQDTQRKTKKFKELT